MRIENGIYYTDTELDITNIYDVVKKGFEEAVVLAREGEVKGFAAPGFDKKYGWNGITYYELINLDYQDLAEFVPAPETTETAAAPDTHELDVLKDDIAALKVENDELREQVGTLKPFADKYFENSELIEFFDKYREKNEERFHAEIEHFKRKIAEIAADAQAILNKIEE